MPFGSKEDRGETVDFDRVYAEIIKPAVKALNDENILIECLRCDEVAHAGLIHETMIRHILEAEVAVVDITAQNPNVFYELGVRHTLRDRVTVLIRRADTRNPFNIAGMNSIEYRLDGDDAEQARHAITSFVRNGLLSSARDSLIHAMIPGLRVSAGLKPITECRAHPYRLGGTDKEIWLVTGDLRYVNLNQQLRKDRIDIWVSSENINMKMASQFDGSISALVRHLGARKGDTGEIVEDCVADELNAKMRGRQQVNPGTVVATGSGRLAETHGVRRIYHAACVYGTIGGGFHPIAQIEYCVTSALQLADEESRRLQKEGAGDREKPYRSILLPLLGTGSAGADLLGSAKRQLGAAMAFLRGVADAPLERICFLAPTRQHLAAYRLALAELGVAEAGRPGAPQPPIPGDRDASDVD